jgi:hypothetical protein
MTRDPIKDFYGIQERKNKDIRSLSMAMFVPDFIAIGPFFLALNFGFGIVLAKHAILRNVPASSTSTSRARR